MLSISDWLNEPGKQNENIINEALFRTRCCIPAIVQEYNTSNNTISCQPAIRERMLLRDNTYQYVNLPLLINVPVVFPGNANYSISFPLAKGDEVLVLFSDLSIDNFWLKGGVQNPIESRRHDLSDGIAIPCNLSLQKRNPAANQLTFYQNGQSITFSQLKNIVDRFSTHTHEYNSPDGPASTGAPE